MALHVVTGASAGMGAACVTALADAGHHVVAVARRAEALEVVAAGSDAVTTLAADVGTTEGRTEIVAAVENLSGATRPGVTAIIHGAATAVELEPWDRLDAATLTDHFTVHVAAPIELTGELHRRVGVERCIIFDSYSATTPRVGWAAYSILKAAAQMAFRAAAEEVHDVAVARVYPGAVATPLLDRVLEADQSIEATGVYHELARRGLVSTAAQIADSVVALLALDLEEFAADPIQHVGYPADPG